MYFPAHRLVFGDSGIDGRAEGGEIPVEHVLDPRGGTVATRGRREERHYLLPLYSQALVV